MPKPFRISLKLIVVLLLLLTAGGLAAFAAGIVPKTLRQLLLAICVIGPLFLFGEAILEILFQVVAYGFGRALLPVLTFGRARTERSDEYLSFRWHGVARLEDGAYVLSADATSIFGLILIVLAITIGVIAYA